MRDSGKFATRGDFNGDGYADLAVYSSQSRATEPDEISIIFGSPSQEDFRLDELGRRGRRIFAPPMQSMHVYGQGDVNGDGFSDLLVHATTHTHIVFGHAEGEIFRRGDIDSDGMLSINDPVAGLTYQFIGTFLPECLDAVDFDDSGTIDTADAVASLHYQFLGGPPPPAPGIESCGPDFSDDTAGDLGCRGYSAACGN